MDWSIYVVSRLPDGRAVYVGQSIKPEERWYKHKWDANRSYGEKQVVDAAIAKHGEGSFKFEIMPVVFQTQEEADEAEIHMISALKTHVSSGGYNVALGGNGSAAVADETKEKLSENASGQWKSEEMRKKMSDGMKRAWEKRRLRPVSEETRERLSRALKGKRHSEETIAHFKSIKRERGPDGKYVKRKD